MDKRSFALAQESMRSGLYIVTSAHRRTIAGCTCVWVSRMAFMPPLMAVSLAPTRQTFEVVNSARRFCINVLCETDLDLARKFGFNTGYEMDKFEGVEWHKGRTGCPVLESAAAYLDCRVTSIVESGDHRLILGEVVDAGVRSDARPAVYVAESFYSGTPESMIAELAAQQ
jgi:flavin reductase (DIM6/NTAB) family NADH-FMN oxidoreductase RutF